MTSLSFGFNILSPRPISNFGEEEQNSLSRQNQGICHADTNCPSSTDIMCTIVYGLGHRQWGARGTGHVRELVWQELAWQLSHSSTNLLLVHTHLVDIVSSFKKSFFSSLNNIL